MPIEWLQLRLAPIEGIQHGVAATDYFEAEYLGPRTFERIDYPAAQVYPVETSRSEGNEYRHRIEANLIFERTRGYDYLDDVLHPMADVIGECMEQLAQEPLVGSYAPTAIEDFAGELDNTGVVIIRIEFQVTTAVDFADTSPSSY